MSAESTPWLAVVPARAGSRGISGKNRRLVGGRTLAERAMDRALLVARDPERVIVTTDDPVVADLARYRGHSVVDRPPALARADATIADTVDHAVFSCGLLTDETSVAVCQPTSPTLALDTVAEALAAFSVTEEWDSLALVTDDRHLMWREGSDGAVTPIYEERANRQFLNDHVWRETGGLMLARRWLGPASLVSERHYLWPTSPEESIDVDTPLDLAMADAAASCAVVEWRVIAGQTVGYGHLYRAGALIAEMPRHLHRIVVDGPPEALAVAERFAPAIAYGEYYETAPDVVVFDCLIVATNDYERAREERSKVVGMEIVSLPPNARFDLYVDELGGRAPEVATLAATEARSGPAFCSLRDEFRAASVALETGAVEVIRRPGSVLVTFGGGDPERMTERALEALAERHDVRAVIGPGFDAAYAARLRERWPESIVEPGAVRMAHEMLAADAVVTSTGRTVWEAASLGCSIVTVPVNERERDHGFPGYARRIPAYNLDGSALRLLVDACLGDDQTAEGRRERARSSGVDRLGPRRIAWLFDGLIGGYL